MTRGMKSRSERPQRARGTERRRAIDLSPDDSVKAPPSPEQQALLSAGRKDLLAHIAMLQSQNMALHGELSIQHEKSNQALRMLGSQYQFMFGIIFAYMEALRNFKEAGNKGPIPTIWLAARVCETFEAFFERFNVTEFDMGPDRDLLRNAFSIANRPLNPGSKIAAYLGIQPPAETPPAEKPETKKETEKKAGKNGAKKKKR